MARGYNSSADVIPTTIDGVPLANLWMQFQEVNAAYNASTSAIAGLFTSRTTNASDLIPLSNEGAEFELESEYGLPQGFRAKPSFTQVGFPLRFYDLGVRYTRAFLRNASAEQVRSLHDEALAADDRNVFRSILRAVFTQNLPAARSANENGVPVFSFFDGGSDSNPARYAGKNFAAGHTHYSTTSSALPDGLDVAFLIRQVTEHGHGSQQGEQIVLLVNPQEGETVRGLRVGSTSPFDFIPSESAPAYLSTASIIGDVVPGEFRGLPVSGSYGRALIIEQDYVPAGYMTAVAVSPGRSPLAFREHATAQYRGLQLLPGSHPGVYLFDSSYEHGFGVGVRHRGAAAAMQVTTSTTYTSPTIS